MGVIYDVTRINTVNRAFYIYIRQPYTDVGQLRK